VIRISTDPSRQEFLLAFPFNSSDIHAVRNLPIRAWDKHAKVWKVPFLAVHSLDGLGAYWSESAAEWRRKINSSLGQLIDCKFQSPPESNEKLRAYQRVGTNFLKKAKKAILADEPGLGKTIQSIAAVIENEAFPCLIVCPATLKWNWHRQLVEHFGIEPVVVDGNAENRHQQWLQEAQFHISNYDILHPDSAYVLKTKWASSICDEAVYIKNEKALRSKAVRKLLKTEMRIALSGIPMENHLGELNTILQWVRPEIVPNSWNFKKRYCILDWNGKVAEYKNMEEYHMLTSPFILRREKKDVLLELPPKVYTDIPIDLSDAGKKFYKQMAKNIEDELDDGETGEGLASLMQLVRAREFVETPEKFDPSLENEKYQLAYDIYQNHGKLVVFVNFLDALEGLRSFLENRMVSCFILQGEMSPKARIDAVNKFDESERGVFISTDAGRFGLDLVSADALMHLGYFFNPATMQQREDRLHRIGQKESVTIYRPYYRGTIDEGIRKIYMRRALSVQNFVDVSEKMSLARLSRKNFHRIIYGDDYEQDGFVKLEASI